MMTEIIGKCNYCNEPMYDSDNRFISNGEYYHMACWELQKKKDRDE